MRLLRSYVFLFLCFHLSLSIAQNYEFRVFDSNQGLNNPFINSITQDSLGYLWIGTGDGLYRFDGYKFIAFTTDEGLKDNFINECQVSGQHLFLGHNNGAISCLTGKKINEEKSFQVSPSKIINIIPLGSEICIVSQRGFYVFDKENKLLFKKTLKENITINHAEQFDNQLVLNTTKGLFAYYRTKKDKYNLSYQNDTLGVLNTACPVDNGLLIASNNHFLLRLTKKNNTYEIAPANIPFLDGNENINHIRQDYQNNLWIATFGHGVIKLDYSDESNSYYRVSEYNTSNGLNTDYIYRTFQDFEGNTWVGTFGDGLVLLQEDFFTFYHDNEDVHDNNVTAVFIDDSSRWTAIGTSIIKNNTINGEKEKVSFNELSHISALEKINDNILIGTQQSGLFSFNTQTKSIIQLYNSTDQLSNKINDLEVMNDTIWIATYNGLYGLNKTGEQVAHFSTKNGLRHNVINTITQDNVGRLWIGTKSSVVSILEKLKITEKKLPPNIQLINITHIQQAKDNSMWLATSGDGIFQITDSTTENFNTEKGLFSNYCYAVIPIKNESVWVSHKGGLSKVNRWANRIETYSRESGVGVDFNLHAAVTNQSNTEIWFGSKSGIVKYDRTQDASPFQAPMVDFYQLSINNEEYKITPKIQLPYGSYRVRLDFRGLNVAHPEKIHYTYMLEGYEEEWHEYDKTGYAIYSKLEEGTYQFRVIAYNGDVFLESVAPFIIKVKKPIWKEWWFYFLIFILILSIFLGTIFWIKKRHRATQQILQEKIEQATKELDSHNKHLTSSIAYAKDIQNAHLPDHSFLKGHLEEYFIFSRPKDIVGGDFYWFDQVNDIIVIAVGDCTGHGVPGGFMTMLAINQLKSIINEKGITKPSEILNILHQSIISSLNAKEKKHTVSDGMDIGICTISTATNTLEFAGAKRPLLLVREDKPIIIKGTRKTIGDVYSTADYENHIVPFSSKDTIYLFTDGFSDQFGGPRRKKYSTKQLYDFILKNQHYSLEKQKTALKGEFESWRENFDFQIDDVLVCGFKVK